MRAAVFDGRNRQLAIETVNDPTPGDGQVVIKVARCGICGSDVHLAEGSSISFDDQAIPGHEFSGEVVQLGRGVVRLQLGDRVTALPFMTCGHCKSCLEGYPFGCAQQRLMGLSGVSGGFAEYVVADQMWCVNLPDSLTFEDGALIEPLAVGLRANRSSGMRAGERVLVIGAGAIGLSAAYWARRAGAAKVAVSATSTRRQAIALAVGADAFITPTEEATLAEQSALALGGEADVVFECAGAVGSLNAAVSAVRSRGTVSSPGFSWTPDDFVPIWPALKEITIRYSNTYDRREFEIALDALDKGNVEPRAMVTEVVSLADAPAAFETLRQRNTQCKVQISPW